MSVIVLASIASNYLFIILRTVTKFRKFTKLLAIAIVNVAMLFNFNGQIAKVEMSNKTFTNSAIDAKYTNPILVF